MKVKKMVDKAEQYMQAAQAHMKLGDDSRALVQLIELCRFLTDEIRSKVGNVLEIIYDESHKPTSPF